MSDRYWVGGSATWDGTAGSKWSTSSGGAGGAAVPTSSDNVFLNAASGAVTVTVGATATCANLNCTGFTGTLTNTTHALEVYGNLTFVSGMTYSGHTSTYRLFLCGSTSTFTVTTGGKNLGALRLGYTFANTNTYATWSLQDSLTCTLFEMQSGVFLSNNNTINCNEFRVPSSTPLGFSTTTATLGTSTINISGASGSSLFFIQGGIALSAASASLNITYTGSTANKLIDSASQTVGTITLAANSTGSILFRSMGNITTFNVTAPHTLKFTADNTFLFGSINVTSSGSRVSLTSSTPGSEYYFLASGGTDISTDYLTIQDSNADDSSARWFAGNNSVDDGNNEGWIFYDLDTYLWNKPARSIAHGLQVSWKKDYNASIRLFTVGVSLIGANDIIAANEQSDSQWNKYTYIDESGYVLSLDWEQGLSMPYGGISQGLASGLLENTTGRFTPRFMGGSSELFTSILPRRPFIINAGFDDRGVEITDPQFVGLFTKQPEVDRRDSTFGFSGADFINFLGNRYVDNTEMFTGQRSDQLIENILVDLGYTTAQYELDYGINTIPFAIFNKGEHFSKIINDIAQAENAHFFQDNEGILRFENRQHWDNVSDPSYDIFTSQVIDAKAPDDDHIINVVEINADIREKQPLQTVFSLPSLSSILVPAGQDIEQFFSFEDPVLALTDPTSGGANSFYFANSLEDGSGTDLTSSIQITNLGTFAEAVKYRFRNNSASDAYITQFVLAARVAKNTRSLYYRAQDDSSVTAYEERPLKIDNPYIHEESWAASLAQMILNDYAEPENIQDITIMAIPGLRVGDLISWQGIYWRVFNKRSRLEPSIGFVQELKLLKRTITSYFRIGISTIGGVDLIAP